ncbi:hypothetical protein BLNAU_13628 [Blattamonas nauphoetae]|uniref:Uncharacterized protein n=1 Tax=Blattamonas nauphoetae TaxID=2049346 RepID=A0ABQ9XG80_9EUKA|nr:hypothetical protein BLNAU_13628 [Blattamonas nauphoetae]
MKLRQTKLTFRGGQDPLKIRTQEQTKKALVWLIPVVATVILVILILIIVIICRKKRHQKSDKEILLKNQELDQQNPIDVAKMDEQEAMIIAMNAGHTDHIMHHNVPTPIGSHAVAQKEYCDTMDSLNNSGRARANVKTKMGVRCGEELVEVPVNVNDTLYNRLHKGSLYYEKSVILHTKCSFTALYLL